MSFLLPEGSIHISSITLDAQRNFGKTARCILFQTQTGNFTREIPGELSPGHGRKEVLDPALELSARDQLSVSMQYRSRWWGIERTLWIHVKQSEITEEARDNVNGKKTYMKLHKKILVTIDVSRHLVADQRALASPSTSGSSQDLIPPTTSEILRICPRFRLLIIGNSGVGKSTLIQSVFGVKDVDVSEASRGRADIDREFVAAENGLFVLHDSTGLEAAEGRNLARVKQFIGDRRKKEDLQDRLHAVWVCLAVPYAKGRLLEAGMEEFLRNRREILGDIPIVVVLTKLDLLDNALMLALRMEGVMFKTIAEAKPHLEPRRITYLKEYCTQPLLRAAESEVPHVAVSTKIGYRLEPTISDLVKITTSEIERYIKADPSYAVASERSNIERDAPLYIAGMAQRASIEAKVELTIVIGKKRYWKNLGGCIGLSPEKLQSYLFVLHQDIIQVWNFNDPDNALQGDSFKEALLDTSNLGVNDPPGGTVAPLLSALPTHINDLAMNFTAFSGRVGTFALTRFWPEGLKSAETIAKSFMTYIADLVYVMKILFILAPQGLVTSQDVPLALEVYQRLTYRNRVHLEIRDFDTNFVTGRSEVLDKIEVVIRRYNITDEDASFLRSQIRVLPRSSQNVSASF